MTRARRILHLVAGLLVTIVLGPVVGATAVAQEVWPGTSWASTTPELAGMDRPLFDRGVAYAQAYGGSAMIVRGGKRIGYWGDQVTPKKLFSVTKTIGALIVGLGMADGRAALSDRIYPVVPDFRVPPIPALNNAAAQLPGITLGQLARHQAGFDKTGGFGALLFPPGTAWFYSDGGANWVADHLTLRFGQDLDAVLRARVLDRLQVPVTALIWRQNAYRPRTYTTITRREFGAGISANVDAMARLGLLLLRDGRWNGQRLLPAGFTSLLSRPGPATLVERFDASVDPEAPRHYGLLAWNNADGWLKGVPTDAFWAWGLAEQLIVVIPSLDLVIARTGSPMGSTVFGQVDRLEPFLSPVARSVRRANAAPVVNAGADAVRVGAGPVVLDARVQEDGLPGTSAMSVLWKQLSGPAPATIHKPARLATSVTLPAKGTYVLTLTASDGALSGSDSVTITAQ